MIGLYSHPTRKERSSVWRRSLSLALLVALLVSSARAAPALAQSTGDGPVTVTVTATPFAAAAPCTGAFVEHDLPHVTTTDDGVIRMFQGNGSGVAVGDLDNDGDFDILLGNLHGPNTLLWNQGDLTFSRTTFGDPNTRALTLVDVDADGFLDIVLTRNTGTLTYWRNTGAGEQAADGAPFERRVLSGVSRPAYAINWADVDLDGDLDLATATYDAGLLTDLGNEYLIGGGGGVFLWENRDGRFRMTPLAREAQALALLFVDVDGNARPDLLVGNDFDVRDYAFLNRPAPEGGAAWNLAEPFAHTTHSTMSLESGDVHNDGRDEIFASDMKPYEPTDPTVAMAWAPMMATMPMIHDLYNPQVMENVLLARDDSQMYYNVSEDAEVDATGWSWSARFGDLDLDGALDLYVVNGFTEEQLLRHLPNHELVEENQALRNDGSGSFDEAPEWGLNSTRSGRSMILADMDNDGDLDVVVNNVRAPAALYENRLCVEEGSGALRMRLLQPGEQNRNAVGARVVLYTNQGRLSRTVRAGSGYLAGEAPKLHFGLGPGMEITRVRIDWPDGATSWLEPPAPGATYTVTRQ
jgi:hypothetical protein